MVFPPLRSTRARAVAVSGAVLAAGIPLLATGAHAQDDLHRKQSDAHRSVRSAQGDLEDSSADLRAASKRLASSRAQLRTAQARLTATQRLLAGAVHADSIMQVRLAQAQEDLATARTRLDAAKRAVAEQRREIGELAADNYAHGDPALMGLSVILNSQDPATATTQLNTISSLMSRQSSLLIKLKAARVTTQREKDRVARATTAVAKQKAETAANVVRRQELEQQAAADKASVATLVGRNHAAQILATRARAADERQLRAAERQEAKIRRLIMERAARQHGGYRGDTGGFLYRPVPGAVTSPFGYRIHPIYHYWGLHDGTDFHAPCGTPERAAAAGTVISKQWSNVYGNRLYVDLGKVNGQNMTVVYNHLSAYQVDQGQRVSRGQVVGLAGTTGWSTACHLHFTVLLDGKPVDPMHYV